MHVPPCLAFLAGSPSFGEMAVVFLAVLVVFGPRRLPELARRLGKILGDLRSASEHFRDEIMSIDHDLPAPPPDAPEGDWHPRDVEGLETGVAGGDEEVNREDDARS